MGEWLLSRRDSAIVAWHEVPGNRRPKEPSRRVRSDPRRYAHGFDAWSGQPSLKKHGAPFRRKTSGIRSAPNHTVHYRTVLWGGAVPGTSCQATIGPSLRD